LGTEGAVGNAKREEVKTLRMGKAEKWLALSGWGG
jgi:hypothetical protein